jgi:hypothetical protein
LTSGDQFNEWGDWLGLILKDVQNLAIGHHVFRRVRQIVQENERLHQPSSFYDLMTTTFSAWAAMAIRRQTEGNSVSLARLLKAIKKQPEVLSRVRFVAGYTSKMQAGSERFEEAQRGSEPPSGGAYVPEPEFFRKLANEAFDKLVGVGAAHIDPATVEEDWKKLWKSAEKVQTFASKRVAHLIEQPTEIPTMDQLGVCVEAFEGVVFKYLMLFRASGPQRLLPTWQYDWTAIYAEAWLPSSVPNPIGGLSRRAR